MKTSFNQIVKAEIIKNSHDARICCVNALFSAMLSAQGGVSVYRDRIGFSYKTRSGARFEFFLGLVERLVSNEQNESPTISPRKEKDIFYASAENAKALLMNAGLINYSDGLLNIVEGVPDNIDKVCCAKSYLKGLFLESGAIKSPSESGYHFEIIFGGIDAALDCIRLFEELGFTARITGRKGINVVYFKDSETICDVLALFGASLAVLEINSSLVTNSIRANANRKVNCDNANIDKSLDASERQISAIRQALAENIELPDGLREISALRLENPEASIAELAASLGISKSGASHRLNRLIKFIFDEIKKQRT